MDWVGYQGTTHNVQLSGSIFLLKALNNFLRIICLASAEKYIEGRFIPADLPSAMLMRVNN